MAYQPRDYSSLRGTPGFSDELLGNHFTLYEGYVTNTNKVADRLKTLVSEGLTGSAEYAELKRRFGWEFNGMRLHEHYFENISGSAPGPAAASDLAAVLTSEFGSYENWEKDFRSVGALRGIGWVVLYRDAGAGRLFNTWINEHDVGHLSGATPLLIMDVFEHAFMLDYGLKRPDYIEAFVQAIDWQVVSKRSE